MKIISWQSLAIVGIILSLSAPHVSAQDDVADVPSQDLRVGHDENKRFFLIGAAKDVAPPVDGFGLVVVLPGGDGSAEFLPFVKRIYKYAMPEGYILAEPVAVKWNDEQAQNDVWPTKKSHVKEMKFTTEEFVDAVIKEVDHKTKLDRKRIFTLCWSSSGLATYAISLTSKRVTGSFIAMSVFYQGKLPPLAKAKGQAYFLFHCPDDQICSFKLAELAQKKLGTAGATVKLVKYNGGHGWTDAPFVHIREGIDWLEKNHATSAKQ